MTLHISRRGLVPPFIAMDVLRAANRARSGWGRHHPPRSRPAGHAGAAASDRNGPAGTRK